MEWRYRPSINPLTSPFRKTKLSLRFTFLCPILTISAVHKNYRRGKGCQSLRALAWKSPLWLENDAHEQGKPLLQESEKGAIVKKIFQSIAEGKTQAEEGNTLKRKGHYFSTSTLSDLLRNKVIRAIYMSKVVKREKAFLLKDCILH